jgi:hypothetical protein
VNPWIRAKYKEYEGGIGKNELMKLIESREIEETKFNPFSPTRCSWATLIHFQFILLPIDGANVSAIDSAGQ